MFSIFKHKKEERPVLLVVEDNPTDRKIIRKAVSDWQIEVKELGDGESALDFMKEHGADLILLDILLPGIDGYEVCARLKELPEASNIPIIFITSKIDNDDLSRGFKLGAVDYIRKPLNITELKARLRVHLELKKRTDDLQASLDEMGLLKQAVEAVSTGITISSYDGNILYINPSEAHMHGYEREELLGRHVSLFSPEGRIQMPSPEEATKGEWIREVMNVRKNGDTFPVRLKSAFLYDADGSPVNRISIAEDISEQRKAANDIKAYLEQLETAKTEMENAHEDLRLANIETIYVLTRIAEYRDSDTAQHIKRIGLYARMLADHMGLDSAFCELLMYASPMHDVGKIGIFDSLLLKNGPLTDQEFAVMKQHSVLGAELLKTNHKNPVLELASEIAYSHHEHWDGSGYPEGLKGEDIPLSARITMLADHYDALRSRRPYRPGMSHEETMKVILEGDDRTSVSHFDPTVLEAFKTLHEDFDGVFSDFSG